MDTLTESCSIYQPLVEKDGQVREEYVCPVARAGRTSVEIVALGRSRSEHDGKGQDETRTGKACDKILTRCKRLDVQDNRNLLPAVVSLLWGGTFWRSRWHPLALWCRWWLGVEGEKGLQSNGPQEDRREMRINRIHGL